MVSFFLKGATVDMNWNADDADPCAVVRLIEREGSSVSLVVKPSNAAEAIAIADAIRSAALTYLPAPVPVEV